MLLIYICYRQLTVYISRANCTELAMPDFLFNIKDDFILISLFLALTHRERHYRKVVRMLEFWRATHIRMGIPISEHMDLLIDHFLALIRREQGF